MGEERVRYNHLVTIPVTLGIETDHRDPRDMTLEEVATALLARVSGRPDILDMLSSDGFYYGDSYTVGGDEDGVDFNAIPGVCPTDSLKFRDE